MIVPKNHLWVLGGGKSYCPFWFLFNISGVRYLQFKIFVRGIYIGVFDADILWLTALGYSSCDV